MRAGLFAGLLLAWGAAFGAPQVAIDSKDWRLESQYDGISIYSCHVQGTGIVPFKSVMTIPSSIEEISAVLEDASRRIQWINRFHSSQLIERSSDYEQTEYLRMSMPWPFMDRTSQVRVLISVSDDMKTATIAGSSVRRSPADFLNLPELVRADIYDSTFQMTRVEGGTEVTALVFIDPRGNLPQWVVNLFTSKVSRKTLEGLRAQVARNLYSKAEIEALHQRIINYSKYKKMARP